MADRKLMEEYESSVMSLAVSEMLEEFGKELEEEYKNMDDIPDNPEAGEKFYKALDREYRKGRIRSFGKKAATFGRYAVTVCAVIIVFFSISVVSVDALRIKFLDWLTNIHSTHTTYNDSYNINDVISPGYLPDGYNLQLYSRDNTLTTQKFVNGNGKSISIAISTSITNSSNAVINADNESTSSEFIDVNGNTAVYTQKDEISSLMWIDGNTSYLITTSDNTISEDILVKIAQSLK